MTSDLSRVAIAIRHDSVDEPPTHVLSSMNRVPITAILRDPGKDGHGGARRNGARRRTHPLCASVFDAGRLSAETRTRPSRTPADPSARGGARPTAPGGVSLRSA